MTYYLTSSGKTVGGPYANLEKLAKGVKAAQKKGIKAPAPVRRVSGYFHPLSVDEFEVLLAILGDL